MPPRVTWRTMTSRTVVLPASVGLAVTALLLGSATTNQLLSAPVPAVCRHKAGRLVNGVLPGIPAADGYMQLAWLDGETKAKTALTASGDLARNGIADVATLLACSAGTVPWPQLIAFYAHGSTLLGWASLADFHLPGTQAQENASARQITYRDRGINMEWSTQEGNLPCMRSGTVYVAEIGPPQASLPHLV
jgi:hypothetical protein